MRHGYKVFDADGHVVEPRNLWERFLDKKFQHRVGWKEVPGREAFRPATVDGRYTQSLVTIYGDFMEAVNWTFDNMRRSTARRWWTTASPATRLLRPCRWTVWTSW